MTKKVFGIENDQEFAYHVAAEDVEIYEFENENAPGPSVQNLHMHLPGQLDSAWNARALRLLVKWTQDSRTATTEWAHRWEGLPAVSDELVKAQLHRRMTNLFSIWRRQPPRATDNGRFETREEVEHRLAISAATEKTRTRRYTRRYNVSYYLARLYRASERST